MYTTQFITIEEPTVVRDPQTRQEMITWTEKARLAAKVKFQTIQEKLTSQNRDVDITIATFEIPYLPTTRVTQQDRISFDGELWDVESVDSRTYYRKKIIIGAKLIDG